MWADRLSMSTPSSLTSRSRNPAACTASVCTAMVVPRLFASPLTTREISATGSIVPISLLASMTLTTVVRSVIALPTSSGSTMPDRSTGRYVTSKPCRSSWSQEWSTAWCSMFDVTM